MIGRLAVRTLTAHPVRSAVLAAGFGVGVAVMAILLGVAEVVLQQAQAPALVGGGDVLIRMNPEVPARVLLTGTLQSDALRSRVRVASPAHTRRLYLVHRDRIAHVAARGGIPSLERALGDGETSPIAAWQDSPADVAWTQQTPAQVLRHADRFHPIPDAPEWSASWAEWLYFNGRSRDARFYLTFLVGPRTPRGTRTATVRLQLERGGRVENYRTAAELTEADVQRAPDLTIGPASVRLDGMDYRIQFDLPGEGGRRAAGDLTLHASPGRLVPPFEVAGIRGWRTGYVVPVMSGMLLGTIRVGDDIATLDGGTGYHDHNWGFWQGVSWQWGQVQHGDVSFLYGRVFPPPDAADPERFPGFVGALGPDGPIAYATNVTIDETNAPDGAPRTITIRGRGSALDVTLRLEVASSERTRMSQEGTPSRRSGRQGAPGSDLDFLQMRGQYTVNGRAGNRTVNFSAPGSAETFRGTMARSK
jgi:hypothetical protein